MLCTRRKGRTGKRNYWACESTARDTVLKGVVRIDLIEKVNFKEKFEEVQKLDL